MHYRLFDALHRLALNLDQRTSTIQDLVRAIYAQDEAAPARWIIDLVAKDAACKGWGNYTGVLKKKFRPAVERYLYEGDNHCLYASFWTAMGRSIDFF